MKISERQAQIVMQDLSKCHRRDNPCRSLEIWEIPKKLLDSNPVLYDMMYGPKSNPFLSQARNEKTMSEKLAGEIIAASKEEGAAYKKKEDTHRMAEANKAFSHFRF